MNKEREELLKNIKNTILGYVKNTYNTQTKQAVRMNVCSIEEAKRYNITVADIQEYVKEEGLRVEMGDINPLLPGLLLIIKY